MNWDNIAFTGQKITLIVGVILRQNAAWQGTFYWDEQKKTQEFNSTLEFVKYVDKVVAGENI